MPLSGMPLSDKPLNDKPLTDEPASDEPPIRCTPTGTQRTWLVNSPEY
jgi:hypothetical protein